MNDSEQPKILARLAAENFIGRNAELDALRRHAHGETGANALLLLSAPAVGTTEFLTQTYDRIFREQSEIVPVYFAVKTSDATARNRAARFVQTVLAQTIAFRRDEASLLSFAPNVCELAELADANDGYWIDRLIENCRSENALDDERAFVRNCLSAPLRAAAAGAKIFVMIDDLHEAEQFTDDFDFVEELKEIYVRGDVRFVFAGRRRYLLDAAQTGGAKLNDAEIVQLEPLAFGDARLLTKSLAERYAVKTSDECADLIARQFGGVPTFAEFVFQAAREKKIDFDGFQSVERIYADEIFGGRTKRFYDAVFERIAPRVGIQTSVVGFFHDALALEEFFQSRQMAGWSDVEMRRALRLLDAHEIIRLASNRIEAMTENEILSDYVRARYRLEIAAERRASVIGEMTSEFIRRAPQTMAKFYRRQSAVNLRELLADFNRQDAPAALLDYSIFKESYKGADAAEIFENGSNAEKIALPQIFFAVHAADVYPPINQAAETERVAVARGFDESETETIWIAAEIDSKLEAESSVAEFWCDRLEMIAVACDFENFKLWLVAPEGFSEDAMEILKQRSAIGSSRRQVELLKSFLGAKAGADENPNRREYEIVVPMDEDSELITAHAVEEIAKKHSFTPKAINQIKTALVEACINATEHSLSPDRRIHQKFTVEKDRIVITVSNRGLRLLDKLKTSSDASGEERRGWGLKLMRTLMDEVNIEPTDDGTRISMVKRLK